MVKDRAMAEEPGRRTGAGSGRTGAGELRAESCTGPVCTAKSAGIVMALR
ncbi:MAG: hypothetical protein ACYDHX_14900 [Methanothrix sp.]